jgi:ATP phosphoribosyltransferase
LIRLALPTGDLRVPLAALLTQAGLRIQGYGEGSRSYRFQADLGQDVAIRVFRERDIPVQIALGNYDLGICGSFWVEELARRYPQGALIRLRDLELDVGNLYAAVADKAGSPVGKGRAGPSGPSSKPALSPLRIVSEYANLAEALALSLRLPAYRVLPVWGSAQAYPPEDADVALVAAPDEATVRSLGLLPLAPVLDGCACLVANRRSLGEKDLSSTLDPLLALGHKSNAASARLPARLDGLPEPGASVVPKDRIRLAVPDGHQQRDAITVLQEAGIALEGYGGSNATSRPRADVDGLDVKVIRPQDMPQQVALGSFDLAITGHDWYLDHTLRFPSSPIRELVDLGGGRYSLVATVSEDVPGDDLSEALNDWRAQGLAKLRVASEYTNIADHFARERRLGRYQVIPIGGASEGFVPEDAEILIEGTETGSTLAANRLKVAERLFESTSRLVGHRLPPDGRRGDVRETVLRRFRAVGASVPVGGM